jgi:FkbM family methyltransferase
MTFISYAQNFEDVMLWRALKHVEGGFYIDVGAAHPDDYSVTRAFYDRGWRGINIEPTSRFARLAGARQRDVNLHTAAGCTASNSTLFVVENAKDISTLDPLTAEGYRAAGWTIGESQVPIATLADICRTHVKAEINFLKIDVEGAERNVLLGADLERFRPWIVVVEATAPSSQIPSHGGWEELLTVANYRFVWFDGLNRFYVAGEHWERLSPAFAVPPNVFDDFIRATDMEHLNRIVAAEFRASEAIGRATQAETRVAWVEARAAEAAGLAAQAEARAAAAEARAAAAETRAAAVEARAVAAEARSNEATGRAAGAEAHAVQSETRAQSAEIRAVSAESSGAVMATQYRAALEDAAALRASTSWRLTAPFRALSQLFRNRDRLVGK